MYFYSFNFMTNTYFLHIKKELLGKRSFQSLLANQIVLEIWQQSLLKVVKNIKNAEVHHIQ